MESSLVKEEKVFLQKIQEKIPQELIDIIYSYLPYRVKTFLNRTNYIHYHHFIRENILATNMENYIRDMVMRDNAFVFKILLHENFIRWIFDIKNYKYKNITYNNYLYFIKDFCLIHDSNKCINIIQQFLEKLDLCKNSHKKNTSRNIRWKI